MGKSATSVRFAVVGDLHVTKDSGGALRGFFAQASEAPLAVATMPGHGSHRLKATDAPQPTHLSSDRRRRPDRR